MRSSVLPLGAGSRTSLCRMPEVQAREATLYGVLRQAEVRETRSAAVVRLFLGVLSLCDFNLMWDVKAASVVRKRKQAMCLATLANTVFSSHMMSSPCET